MMRLAQQFVWNAYSTKEQVCDHLPKFIEAYIIPVTQTSSITEYREIIRKSKRLNELLFDNHDGLLKIYNDAKCGGIFNQDNAFRFFMYYTSQPPCFYISEDRVYEANVHKPDGLVLNS